MAELTSDILNVQEPVASHACGGMLNFSRQQLAPNYHRLSSIRRGFQGSFPAHIHGLNCLRDQTVKRRLGPEHEIPNPLDSTVSESLASLPADLTGGPILYSGAFAQIPLRARRDATMVL
jgi:hypothetical protein